MDFYVIHKNQDEKNVVTSKLIGKYPDKESAFKAGYEAFEKCKLRSEWIICVTGNIDENGNANGAYKLYKMWD